MRTTCASKSFVTRAIGQGRFTSGNKLTKFLWSGLLSPRERPSIKLPAKQNTPKRMSLLSGCFSTTCLRFRHVIDLRV